MCRIASTPLLLIVASFIAGTLSSQSCRYTCSELDGASLYQSELGDTDEYLHCVYTLERNDHVYAVCDYDAKSGAGISNEPGCPYRAESGPHCPEVPKEDLLPPELLAVYSFEEVMDMITPTKTTSEPTRLFPRGGNDDRRGGGGGHGGGGGGGHDPQPTSTCSVLTCPSLFGILPGTESGGGGLSCSYSIPFTRFILTCNYGGSASLQGGDCTANDGSTRNFYIGQCPSQCGCKRGKRDLHQKRVPLPTPGHTPSWKSREEMMYAMGKKLGNGTQ